MATFDSVWMETPDSAPVYLGGGSMHLLEILERPEVRARYVELRKAGHQIRVSISKRNIPNSKITENTYSVEAWKRVHFLKMVQTASFRVLETLDYDVGCGPASYYKVSDIVKHVE